MFFLFYNTIFHLLTILDNFETMENISKLKEPDDTLNRKGYSALQIAASTGKTNAVQFLLQHGCNPNLKRTNDLKIIYFFSCILLLVYCLFYRSSSCSSIRQL